MPRSFRSEWESLVAKAEDEQRRAVIDKACGVSHPVWPLSKLVPHGPPQNFEFVHTGMGTARMDLGARKVMSGGVESRHARAVAKSEARSEVCGTARTAGVAPGPLTKSHAAGDAGSGNAPTRTSPRCDSSSAVVASERDVLAAVIRALALHPKVAWATRMNVGGMTLDGRHVRFGFKGCSDIIGQTTDGRFLAVEVKRPGGKPSENQLSFLCRVQRAGGVAFVAWSVSDVARGLA